MAGWFTRNKERERYYLLPGMGGKALRRKQKTILRWSLFAGLVAAAIVGYVMYLLGTH